MKKHLDWEKHLQTDVPSSLDARILAAGALRARQLARKRKQLKFFIPSSAAAAAAVLVFSINVIPGSTIDRQENTLSGQELLALADFTLLEQSNFNLDQIAAEYENTAEQFLI